MHPLLFIYYYRRLKKGSEHNMAFDNNTILIRVDLDTGQAISDIRTLKQELQGLNGSGSDSSNGGVLGKIGGLQSLTVLNDQLSRFVGFVDNINRTIGEVIKNAGAMTVNAVRESIAEYQTLSKSTGELRGLLRADGMTDTYTTGALKRIDEFNKDRIKNGSLSNEQELLDFEIEEKKTDLNLNNKQRESALRFMEANGLEGVDVAKISKMFFNGKEGEEYTNMLPWFYNALQRSADLSPADVEDFLSAFSYSHPSASANAKTAKELQEATASELAFETVMSNMGIQASAGGTMFRRTMTNVLTEGYKAESMSKKKQEALANDMIGDTGVSLYDVYSGFANLLYSGGSGLNSGQYAEAILNGNTDKYNTGKQLSTDEILQAFSALGDLGLNDEQMNTMSYLMAGMQGLQGFYGLLDSDQYREVRGQIMNSDGAVDKKYAEVESSSTSKKIEFENLLSMIMGDIGEGVNPLTEGVYEYASEVLKSMFKMDGTPNANILREKISEVGDYIGATYGDEARQAFENLGNKIVDWIETIVEIAPQVFSNLATKVDALLTDLENGDMFSFIRDLLNIGELGKGLEGSTEQINSKIQMIQSFLNGLTLLEGLKVPADLGSKMLAISQIVTALGMIKLTTGAGAGVGGAVAGASAGGVVTGLEGIGAIIGGAVATGLSAITVAGGLAITATGAVTLFGKLLEHALGTEDVNTAETDINWSQNGKVKKARKVQPQEEADAREHARKRYSEKKIQENVGTKSPNSEVRLISDALQGINPKTQQPVNIDVPQRTPVNTNTTVQDNITTNTTVQNGVQTTISNPVTVPFSVSMSVPVTVLQQSKTIVRTISGTKGFTKGLNNTTSKSNSSSSHGKNVTSSFGQYR